jgi:hypothetical protein
MPCLPDVQPTAYAVQWLRFTENCLVETFHCSRIRRGVFSSMSQKRCLREVSQLFVFAKHCFEWYRVIKKSLWTWWLNYRKLHVMFKVFPVSFQQWCTEGSLGGYTPLPKFRYFDKAEPNSQFRGKYTRNNLMRIRVSLICKLSGTPD